MKPYLGRVRGPCEERSGQDNCVGAALLGAKGVVDDTVRRHIDGAGQYRHLATGRLDRHLNHTVALRIGEVCNLAGRAQREQAIDPGIEQEGDMALERSGVYFAVGARGVQTGGTIPSSQRPVRPALGRDAPPTFGSLVTARSP